MNSRAQIAAAAVIVAVPLMTLGDLEAQRIPLTEEHTVASEHVDEEYLIQVGLPDGYEDAGAEYPVVYVLDAEKSFGLTRDIVNWLSWAGEIPPMIVVGISYGEDGSAWWSKRSRDLTPTPDRSQIWGDWPLAGGASDFRAFMARELFPLVEGNYRTNEDRTLVGISFGGLFGAYDLLQSDRLFMRYLLVSPALAWDHEVILQVESRYRANNDRLAVRLYTAVGGRDQSVILESWQHWNRQLEESGYRGLAYHAERIEGETHISVFPTAVTHGLKALWEEQQ